MSVSRDWAEMARLSVALEPNVSTFQAASSAVVRPTTLATPTARKALVHRLRCDAWRMASVVRINAASNRANASARRLTTRTRRMEASVNHLANDTLAVSTANARQATHRAVSASLVTRAIQRLAVATWTNAATIHADLGLTASMRTEASSAVALLDN